MVYKYAERKALKDASLCSRKVNCLYSFCMWSGATSDL